MRSVSPEAPRIQKNLNFKGGEYLGYRFCFFAHIITIHIYRLSKNNKLWSKMLIPILQRAIDRCRCVH